MKPETAKRTALEWLEYEFVKLESTIGVHSSMYHLIEKAKEMEKEQMDKVAGDWWNEGASYMYDGKRKYESFEDYYNKTFNTNEK
jgi:bisphosphoglycerate-independent phosphoglycerate mutase (AlkP superfamily)